MHSKIICHIKITAPPQLQPYLTFVMQHNPLIKNKPNIKVLNSQISAAELCQEQVYVFHEVPVFFPTRIFRYNFSLPNLAPRINKNMADW